METASTTNRTTYAVLMTDVYRFSMISGLNEEPVIQRVAEDLRVFRTICEEHRGRVETDRGDGLMMVFESAVEALRAAVRMQTYARNQTQSQPVKDRVVWHRMGLNFGDVMLMDSPLDGVPKVTGHVVNIAARMEQECTPGKICFTQEIYQLTKGKVDVPISYVGSVVVKNVPDAVRMWTVAWEEAFSTKRAKTVQEDELVRKAVTGVRHEFDDQVSSIRRAWTIGSVLAIVIVVAAAVTYVGYNAFLLNPQQKTGPYDSTSSGMGTGQGAGSQGDVPGVGSKPPAPITLDKDDAPVFDQQALGQKRLDMYRRTAYEDFVAEVEAIDNWKNSQTLRRWHGEAKAMAAGLSAFKSMLERIQEPISASAEGKSWKTITGYNDGVLTYVTADSENELSIGIDELNHDQLEGIYKRFLRPAFGRNSAVEAWIPKVTSKTWPAGARGRGTPTGNTTADPEPQEPPVVPKPGYNEPPEDRASFGQPTSN